MTTEMMKQWARENNKTEMVAELVSSGGSLEWALTWVYDMNTLSKEEFKKKHFGC